MRRAALIFNPAAGRGAEDLERVRDALAARFELTVYTTERDRDGDACARAALSARPDLVVAAGGDGTVSLVAAALVGSGVTLGIIPRGTANSMATALAIPADLDGALATLFNGEVRVLDSARANGRAMLLHASLGFHAAAVGDTTREDKNRWGMLAYVKEGLRKLTELEPFLVELETERERVSCRAVNVTVANAVPTKTLLAQGPARVIPDDGLLDVTIVAATGLADAVATGLHLLRTAALGEAATRDNVGYLEARRLRIHAEPAQPLLIDGEPAGEGDLNVECVPQSVRVLVPAGEVATPPPAREGPKLEGLPELAVKRKRS